MLAPYDPQWPSLFEEARAALRAAGNAAWEIEPIGSTAVPGMSAKPVIDIAVRSDGDFDDYRPLLEEAGWCVGSSVRTHPVMIFAPDGRRTRIAHFFTPSQWPLAHQRVLRDWLRTHPEDAALYEQAKADAAVSATDRRSYNDGKTLVIQQIMDRARAARGLASVIAFEK
ncbi:GrpB-like predicted nucleotidyltransferase (UPF0157 family) [Microbacterium sp. W4I4]|uniref:GrpB family protein n=1 Tax=Microbacterium sp. W4I4 TaxID=3042295 RepID=UPI00278592B7|nr:GrpB family protein [Microbacterium sp. W4I4]MDQ0614641.1 GrpB-like predicted nucleotidyltransferase (UPF0157 family) [Microbacterium sp. W4I4]